MRRFDHWSDIQTSPFFHFNVRPEKLTFHRHHQFLVGHMSEIKAQREDDFGGAFSFQFGKDERKRTIGSNFYPLVGFNRTGVRCRYKLSQS